jgi:hypothetical protein
MGFHFSENTRAAGIPDERQAEGPKGRRADFECGAELRKRGDMG